MKKRSFTRLLIFLTLCVSVPTLSMSDEVSGPSATGFMKMWEAWNTSQTYKYADLRLFRFEFRCKIRNATGGSTTERRVVHFGESEHNPFGLLFEMKAADRLRNIQATADDNRYTMIFPRALTLKEGGRVKRLDCQLECIFDRQRPRRFMFFADKIPRRFSTRQLRVIYTWDIHAYNVIGEEELFWAPVEIAIEQLVRMVGPDRRARYVAISERWTLLRILEVKKSGVEDWFEVDDEEVED